MKAYYGITITVVDNSPHFILPLLQAIDPTVPSACRHLCIQNDPGNTGHTLLIGDDGIDIGPGASTKASVALTAGQFRQYEGTTVSGLPFGNMWVADESAGGNPVNIEIIP